MKVAFVSVDLFHVFACMTAELCSVSAVVGISRTFSLPDCKGSISKVSMQNQLGPKLLVSSLTTHDRPVLKWRLRVTGNAAVEFGVVPSNLAVNLAYQQLCFCNPCGIVTQHAVKVHCKSPVPTLLSCLSCKHVHRAQILPRMLILPLHGYAVESTPSFAQGIRCLTHQRL